MKNPLDTVFGRLVVTTVGLLLLVHLTSLLLIDRTRASLAASHISRVVEAGAQMSQQDTGHERSVADILGISLVDIHGLPPADGQRFLNDTIGPLEQRLRRVLPAGSHVALDSEGTLRVLPAGSSRGIVLPQAEVPLSRFTGVLALTLVFAIVVAVVLAWQLNRPIRDLAAAAREHRTGHHLSHVRKRGPRELRELIGDFNDMTRELAEVERERAVMLASIAHDLRTPITRMQVRADLLADPGDRDGFLRDAESMSRVITQFLDFARESPEGSPQISVDARFADDSITHTYDYREETRMLSPHEFATLMLIKDAPDQIDLDRAELDTLLEHQLVALEELASGGRRPRLTRDGNSLLDRIDRGRRYMQQLSYL
ncbi:histidine kinase dimerization/phospho-acceptor domain-containing protein [Paraburkholderia sp. WC7.3d]|uniref:histidine kinase n=1 Tax=Paraburkholderia podalyriae TaxID=1938811 RepID=A0ABR7PXN4_9BURK|nr:HAMP domain-containing protein [Paraburkholderia podalyriae]